MFLDHPKSGSSETTDDTDDTDRTKRSSSTTESAARRSRKSEIRSSKSETNPNCQEWGNGQTGNRDVSSQAESNLDYSSTKSVGATANQHEQRRVHQAALGCCRNARASAFRRLRIELARTHDSNSARSSAPSAPSVFLSANSSYRACTSVSAFRRSNASQGPQQTFQTAQIVHIRHGQILS